MSTLAQKDLKTSVSFTFLEERKSSSVREKVNTKQHSSVSGKMAKYDILYLDKQMDPEGLNDDTMEEQMRLLEIPKHQSIQDTNPQNSNARALPQFESN